MSVQWSGERLETFVFNEATLEHLHRYSIAKSVSKNKVVLDIACGDGYGSYLLASEAFTVVGIDINEGVINSAKQRYKRSNLSFKKGNITEIPCHSNTFDIVISFETIEHIEEQHKMLDEIRRVIKPEGLFMVSTPDKKNYTDRTDYNNPYHVKELYVSEFKELLQRSFKNVLLYQQSFVHGSLILQKSNSKEFTLYTGNYNELQNGINPEPMYWIALASDLELKEIPSSFFHNNEVYNKILEDEIAVIKRSFTYRVGNFILKPFKVFRSLYRK